MSRSDDIRLKNKIEFLKEYEILCRKYSFVVSNTCSCNDAFGIFAYDTPGGYTLDDYFEDLDVS